MTVTEDLCTLSLLHILSSRAAMTARFPLERIGNWNESSLHIVLPPCLPGWVGVSLRSMELEARWPFSILLGTDQILGLLRRISRHFSINYADAGSRWAIWGRVSFYNICARPSFSFTSFSSLSLSGLDDYRFGVYHHHFQVFAGQIRGQMSVCRAWNVLPNNVEHKVEAIMEHFGPPPVVPISCRHHDHSTILIILNQQHCLQRGLLIIATMGTTRHVM